MIGQWVARGERSIFHSVTLGGSVFCLRNKINITGKSCELFLKHIIKQIF